MQQVLGKSNNYVHMYSLYKNNSNNNNNEVFC